ncbi:MAG: hypothetical protein Ct9H300mP28_37320 [Pseudomonadota bacterium]|nr:MAG: hypothetical protein Ct9H300mP28_37320 [Pseudomonadota bacterium]
MASADFNNDNKMDFVVGHPFLVSTPGVSLLTGDFSLTLRTQLQFRLCIISILCRT